MSMTGVHLPPEQSPSKWKSDSAEKILIPVQGARNEWDLF
jgi:hypothetical protein